MKSCATVEKIEQEYVIVSTLRKGACGDNCALCNSCTAQKVMTKAYCDIDVKMGDSVIIESSTGSILFAMFIVFLSPIVIPIVFYLIACSLGIVASVIAACVGLIIACFFIYVLSHHKWYINSIMPRIVSINNKK